MYIYCIFLLTPVFSSEYNKFILLSLTVSPFGPHVSKSVRARMSVRAHTYSFCGFVVLPIGSVLLTAFVHTRATGFPKSKPIVIRRSEKKNTERRLVAYIFGGFTDLTIQPRLLTRHLNMRVRSLPIIKTL